MAHHSVFAPHVGDRPIDRLLNPFQRFARIEASGSILLLACTVAALIWANSPWAETYDKLLHTYLSVGFGEHKFKLSLHHFINDGLMAVFFFVVGLEIKRELLAGELATMRKASVPIAAAIGGIIVPAGIFTLFNLGDPEGMKGWGIPMATDIAFAVGVMAMLGKRVPLALKVFLTAAAIVDDIGAVLVIAIFYSSGIELGLLIAAGVLLAIAAGANWMGVRSPIVYAIIGVFMWVAILESGIHATIGGVLLAFAIPAKVRIEGADFTSFAKKAVEKFEEAGGNHNDLMSNTERQTVVHGLEQACEHVQTPVNRLEHALHPWVSFLIMPIFALANAGIPLSGEMVSGATSGVGIGIVVGLVLGKPLGLTLGTFVAIKLGLGALPEGANWKQVIGAGALAGIGFTMSIFIAGLAYTDNDTVQIAKFAILAGSLISGIIGFVLLRMAARER